MDGSMMLLGDIAEILRHEAAGCAVEIGPLAERHWRRHTLPDLLRRLASQIDMNIYEIQMAALDEGTPAEDVDLICTNCGAQMSEPAAVLTDRLDVPDEYLCWRCAPHMNERWIDRVARGEGCE